MEQEPASGPPAAVVGIDGCRHGWVYVVAQAGEVVGRVAHDFAGVVAATPPDAVIAIDIPIGLTDRGPRACDVEARRRLRPSRASSVFPAPVRACLAAASYEDACHLHVRADGHKLSRQAFGILPKIAEVDLQLAREPALCRRVRDVHPEVSFARWNGWVPLQHAKASAAGRGERAELIDAAWPGARQRVWREVRGQCKPDDLHDAFAALWTAQRILAQQAVTLPEVPPRDAAGLRMEIVV